MGEHFVRDVQLSRCVPGCVLLIVAVGMVSAADAASVHLVEQAPVRIEQLASGTILVDFERVAFGNLLLLPPSGAATKVTIHLGEALSDGRVNRNPPGSVRYARIELTLSGDAPWIVAPPADTRNTQQGTSPGTPPAVLTPHEWGVVMPFRWVEIEGWPGQMQPEQIRRRAAFSASWDDDAASFRSSDELLNQIWELCRYSIKATTFAGVYVDGDRERIPYEGDAYVNQLSHHATDRDTQMSRDTFDWLMKYPTWPTEWALHMVFIAHADWMHTGDANWLAPRYEGLKAKLLLERARPDGLITSTPDQQRQGDLVDWPGGERDGYVFTSVNTVVNAFHLRALTLMADLARALQHHDDAAEYAEREQAARAAFQATLFDAARGVYRDGEGTDHASAHANFLPLAFGLVPEQHRAGVLRYVQARGMACSVYAAQYLLESLFLHEKGEAARILMTAQGDRSWRHMVESGTTITWEAWDQRYKPNQDWNHAWGAAPANIIPRKLMGIEPLEPGFRKIRIKPQPALLEHAEIKCPTIRGDVLMSFKNKPQQSFSMNLTIPANTTANVYLPFWSKSQKVMMNGSAVKYRQDGNFAVVEGVGSGSSTFEVVK